MVDDHVQNPLYQGQEFSGIAVQKPVVPDSPKSFGQNMLEHPPQEVFALQALGSDLTGAALGVPKVHLAILVGNDIVFADDTPV